MNSKRAGTRFLIATNGHVRLRRRCLVHCWLLVLAACCGARAAVSGPQFAVNVWTPDQGGLPSSAVLAMIQSR
ncbi:MAG TPA: hypothetical protein VMU04_22820, partial [Candidatus Acidoferrum sp.]|nr:hypothetical protein [Candidatus Acidoferrum sp.]